MPDPVFQFQDVAAQEMCRRERFGLFDAMGVGKTGTAIRAADYAGARRFLGIMPAAIRSNWKREIARFGLLPRRVILIESVWDLVAWMRGHYEVALISFERAANFAYLFLQNAHMFPLVIIDEAHYLKSEKANRTTKILGPDFDGCNGILMWAKQAWWLTGTPAPNDPADVFTFLKFLKNVMPISREDFIKRYFKARPTQYGSKQTAKREKLPELQDILRANSISRSQQDVGIFLPPVFLTPVTVDGDVAAINALLQEFPDLDARVREAIENGVDLSDLDDEHMAALRRIIAEAKAPQYARMVYEELQSGLDKVVIFGHHRSALLSIAQYLSGKNSFSTVKVLGGSSQEERDHAIDSFNNDPHTRVFIGNHRAAGVGLNLQSACCNIDLFEEDWSPAVNAQSIKRIARYGQTRNMRARFIRLDHELEVAVQETNIRKTKDILELGFAGFI